MNLVVKYATALIIGCVVGFVGGFQGISGGFYISMFLLLTGLSSTQRHAAGTTLFAVLFPLSIGAVFEYWKTGDIDLYVSITILCSYIIFVWIGSKVNVMVDESYIFLSLAVTMLLTSIYFFTKFRSIKIK